MGYKDPDKQREYQRLWRAARRKEWITDNSPCVKCGSYENLEVDHVDPSKKLEHKVWSWSKRRRDLELAKCQVLCENCHKMKSIAEGPQSKCGTRYMYEKYGCRCEPCKAAKIVHNHLRYERGYV